ncbi:hypothetical protein F9C11_32175 [Amycolatopsis sp. VS8301801F10]|uniref:hypothetical protein n=1 Tax=Amycolatopsis sp. VS8301801F10 TaxID=2652442 RepID=UPI0038FD2E03
MAQAERLSLSDHASPALPFVAYDLSAWRDEGTHWVHDLERNPAAGIWFGHNWAEGCAGLLVGTVPKTSFEDRTGPLEWEAPGRALSKFLTVIEPSHVPENRRAVLQGIRAHLDDLVAGIDTWPPTPWIVGGHSLHAAVLHYAGAWLAVTGKLDDSYLFAIGVGISPDYLDFVPENGHRYSLDFSKPTTEAEYRIASQGRMPTPNQFHADLARFIHPGTE